MTDDDLAALKEAARAALDKAFGKGHTYGPEEVNVILAQLGLIYAASNISGRLFIITSMQELLTALIDELPPKDDPKT